MASTEKKKKKQGQENETKREYIVSGGREIERDSTGYGVLFWLVIMLSIITPLLGGVIYLIVLIAETGYGTLFLYSAFACYFLSVLGSTIMGQREREKRELAATLFIKDTQLPPEITNSKEYTLARLNVIERYKEAIKMVDESQRQCLLDYYENGSVPELPNLPGRNHNRPLYLESPFQLKPLCFDPPVGWHYGTNWGLLKVYWRREWYKNERKKDIMKFYYRIALVDSVFRVLSFFCYLMIYGHVGVIIKVFLLSMGAC
jgi:hypothetical protein